MPTVSHLAAALIAASLAVTTAALATGSAIPAYVTAAVNDPARSKDAATDVRRHIAELTAFAKIKPGDTVVELVPGNGYFTRVFAKIVGPKGHVYGLWPTEYASEAVSNVEDLRKLAKTAAYANVEVVVQPAAAFKMPKPVDVMFTSQNYHDYPDAFMGKIDPVVFGKQVYAALKPGGVFIVIDHVGEAGSGLRDTDTLHRIDPAKTRALVEAAGFKFDGETTILRNPADDHKKAVFDPSVRGRTDQFAYRFVKPK